MATRIEDPVTGTTWFNSNNPVGSLLGAAFAIVGLGVLFLAIGIGRNTVAPMLGGFVDQLPGVNSGDGQIIRVAD